MPEVNNSELSEVYEWSLNSFLVRLLREELQLLHEPGSYVGEVIKVMGKNKVLVKVQPEGKYSAFLHEMIHQSA
jgi:ATP-dependent 26S proteasome regulatory subunit